MWTANLTAVEHDLSNGSAIKVTITYTNDATGATETQGPFFLAQPEQIPQIADQWILQREKIEAFVAKPPIGPITRPTRKATLTADVVFQGLSKDSLARLWASPNIDALMKAILAQNGPAIASLAQFAVDGGAITDAECAAIILAVT